MPLDKSDVPFGESIAPLGTFSAVFDARIHDNLLKSNGLRVDVVKSSILCQIRRGQPVVDPFAGLAKIAVHHPRATHPWGFRWSPGLPYGQIIISNNERGGASDYAFPRRAEERVGYITLHQHF